MTEKDIAELEELLGALPRSYRDWLIALPTKLDQETELLLRMACGHVYLSPKELIQANQVLLGAEDWLEGTEWSETVLEDYLVIGGDECGNYYIVDPDDEESPVELLAHDPVGIESGFESLRDYCDSVNYVLEKDLEWVERRLERLKAGWYQDSRRGCASSLTVILACLGFVCLSI